MSRSDWVLAALATLSIFWGALRLRDAVTRFELSTSSASTLGIALPDEQALHQPWSRNPFRTSGLRSTGHSDSRPDSTPEAPPAPSYSVRAIVGGPPWSAVLAGVPGAAGSLVVEPGDRVEGYTVIAIDSLRVLIRGGNVTFILTLPSSPHPESK